MGKFKATLLIGSILIHLLVPHQMLLQLLVIVGAAVDDGITIEVTVGGKKYSGKLNKA